MNIYFARFDGWTSETFFTNKKACENFAKGCKDTALANGRVVEYEIVKSPVFKNW